MVVLFSVLPHVGLFAGGGVGAVFPFGVDPALISPLNFDTRTTEPLLLLFRYLIEALLGNY